MKASHVLIGLAVVVAGGAAFFLLRRRAKAATLPAGSGGGSLSGPVLTLVPPTTASYASQAHSPIEIGGAEVKGPSIGATLAATACGIAGTVKGGPAGGMAASQVCGLLYDPAKEAIAKLPGGLKNVVAPVAVGVKAATTAVSAVKSVGSSLKFW